MQISEKVVSWPRIGSHAQLQLNQFAMKLPLSLLAGFLLLARVATFAQSSNSKFAADQAWSSVDNLGKSAAVSQSVPSPKGSPQAAAAQQQKAQNFRQTAQAAKDFYTQYPDHPQAAAAKKLEALAGLAGITDNDAGQEQSAVKVASDFRTNQSNPIADRYEVAHAMERHDVSKKLAGQHWLSSAFEAENMADRLHAEFGHYPAAYANYLTVAENLNCDRGRDVAMRILQMPAPGDVKAGAQRLLDRWRLVRKPLDFPLTTDKGKSTTLGQLAGKLTVVCLWDGSAAPGGPPGLQDFKKNPAPDTKWVYVSLGAKVQLAKGAKPRAMPAGTTCVEPLGLKSPLAAQLKLTHLPYVLVLDENKNLSGYGRIDELPWLLAGTNRLIEP